MSENSTYRPPASIDWDRVDELLEAGCLGSEIAAVFAIHPNTLYERTSQKFGISFSEYSQAKRAKGESALRQVQYDKALGKSKKGDNTMLVWLGKQRLNQKESVSEFSVAPEALQPFTALMGQIASIQDDRKRAAIKDKSSPKSE